jgi:heptosyltransferase-2
MSLPALRALKDHFPRAGIYLTAKKYLFGVYQNLKEIEGMIPIPDTTDLKNTFKSAAILRKYRFDAGILFTNSFNSAFLFKLAGIKDITGYSKDLRGFLLDGKIKFPQKNGQHHINFYMDLAAFFVKGKTGETIDKTYSDQLIIDAKEKETVRSKLAAAGVDLSNRFIGISPSAAYGTAKQWLPERFRELIKRIINEMPDMEILLFGSAKEREKITGVIAPIGSGKDRVHNLAGRLSLRESITAISICDVFVSNDSGLMHTASALRVPLAAVFGPTQPHKTAPTDEKDKIDKRVKVLYHRVQCAPCLYRDCPVDHACMKAVSVDEVWEAINQLL